jgi:hypothetical protein
MSVKVEMLVSMFSKTLEGNCGKTLSLLAAELVSEVAITKNPPIVRTKNLLSKGN